MSSIPAAPDTSTGRQHPRRCPQGHRVHLLPQLTLKSVLDSRSAGHQHGTPAPEMLPPGTQEAALIATADAK
ncbi:hypothetical protein NDU88_005884 [Pleurodeles waltl]|uniref:Uncharacterized protein n=1 Tax=Pleurodeles waltl TaxID=8319 RepID=A0AAV7TCV8_PLEWA|nr:hypothetical protein NDU88_005884 [Pleurodeles waltl]